MIWFRVYFAILVTYEGIWRLDIWTDGKEGGIKWVSGSVYNVSLEVLQTIRNTISTCHGRYNG